MDRAKPYDIPKREVWEGAPSTCQVALAGRRRLAVSIGVYCQPTLQISAQTRNLWVLEVLCSAAVT